jgi:hypothetical protein
VDVGLSAPKTPSLAKNKAALIMHASRPETCVNQRRFAFSTRDQKHVKAL